MSRTVVAAEAICTRAMVFGEAYLAIIVGGSAAAVLADYVLLDAVDIAVTGAPIIPLRKKSSIGVDGYGTGSLGIAFGPMLMI